MRIGFDFDDTLTNTWESMKPIFSKAFGKSMDELNNSKPYYESVKDIVSTKEEYFKIIGEYYDNLDKILKPKENASKILKILHDMGIEIFIITARGQGFNASFETTKNFLDNHNIYYDKLIVNALDKAKVCMKEKIDLFIDDSVKHCKNVAKLGIDVIMFETTYNKMDEDFKHVKSLDEIINYVKN